MLASAIVLLEDAGLGRNHCSTGYMSHWMMGSRVDGCLLVVGVGGWIGVFCLWLCAGASWLVFWIWRLATPWSFHLP